MNRAAIGSTCFAIVLGVAPLPAQEAYWRPVGGQPVRPNPIVTVSLPAQPRESRLSLDSAGWIRIPPRSSVGEEQSQTAPERLPEGPAANPPETIPTMPSASTPVTTVTPLPNATAVSAPTALPANVVSTADTALPRWQVSGEYLLWYAKGSQVPPLLSQSPPVGANGINGSVPGSTVLIEGEDLDDATRQGGRFGVTYWLDGCNLHGFEGRLFFTGQQTNDMVFASRQPDGADANLFRPFFAPNRFQVGTTVFPGPFSERVTGTGISSGSFTANSSSYFWGAEANYRDCLYLRNDCNREFRADLLAGFRYLQLDESLTLTEDFIRLTPSASFPDEITGTRVVVTDRFATTNDFYGGQVGTLMTYSRKRWSVDLRGTVALGVTHQTLTIDGGQTRGPLATGGTFNAVGGLLAIQGTNIGQYTRDVLSVVPEVGLTLGYQVTPRWRAIGGYNFLYWSNVVRPGDQIDTVVDVTRIPRFVPPNAGVQPTSPPRPAVLFQNTDFWAQGINLGAEYRW